MKKKRVLVVDDSEIVLAAAREALEEEGFEVVTALNALEADAHIICKHKPDIIVLDVMLPVLDGDKKAKMLKENELTGSIPILLLSSKPESVLRCLVEESGSDGFVRKPFSNRQLVTKVRETLDGKPVGR